VIRCMSSKSLANLVLVPRSMACPPLVLSRIACTASIRAPVELGFKNPGFLKGKGSPYSITERRVPELTPVLDSQPAGDVSHKPGGRLPLLSARPAVTPATFKRADTNFAAW